MQRNAHGFYFKMLSFLGLFLATLPGFGQNENESFSAANIIQAQGTPINHRPANPQPNYLADTTIQLPANIIPLPTDSVAKDALLQKPTPLKKITIKYDEPLFLLDLMVVKKTPKLKPYIPFVQDINFLVDYGKLGTILLTKLSNQEYESGLSVIFRKNIALSIHLGYAELDPSNPARNTTNHIIQGKYRRIGLGYVVHYSAKHNLYAGLRYSGSNFEANETALTATWFEVVVGSEKKLFKKLNLYAGLFLKLNLLHTVQALKQDHTCPIPGYGSILDKTIPAINLYLKYKITFLKKYMNFN